MPPRKRERELAFETKIFFKPRTDRQAAAVETMASNDIVFLIGPAGTGKTHMAVYLALREMYGENTQCRKNLERIVITRPIVEAGEHLGALPGEVAEKVHPYMLPIYDCVSKMVNNSDKFVQDNFEIAPLAFMRGRTFEHCAAILDEAQNCTVGQILLFLSRLGTGAKLLISGDTDQTDIAHSGLSQWVDALQGVPGVGFVEFTEADIVRHPLVREILKRRPRP